MQAADGTPSLTLIPNPAQNSTRIDYVVGGNGTNGTVEVVEMTGRLMGRYEVASPAGSLQLPLDNYAAGVYLVVLRENGKIVQQSKLSVIR
jgi:hypothetical protein